MMRVLRKVGFWAAFSAAIALISTNGWSASSPKPSVRIPTVSYLYGFKLQRAVVERFGTNDALARIAAQIHQESVWDAKAKSKYAQGMAQFTPDTAQWLQGVCPEIGAADPWDPNWSMRAAVCYDHWLYARVGGATQCDRWAFTLSSYNGGLTWLQRDQQMTRSNGADPARWFANVELYSPRSAAARRENRGYVRIILRDLEPAYIDAGWPGTAVCT